MNGQPEQVVYSRRYSRTQIGDRAVPLELKDVLHYCLGQFNQALLGGEVPYDSIVEDNHVFFEGRV